MALDYEQKARSCWEHLKELDRDIVSERAARAREEARALALEAELARVRAEAEEVRAFYEEREEKLKARIGGEMLRAEKAEELAHDADLSLRMYREIYMYSENDIKTLRAMLNGCRRGCAEARKRLEQERDAARRDYENALTALEEVLAGRA